MCEVMTPNQSTGRRFQEFKGNNIAVHCGKVSRKGFNRHDMEWSRKEAEWKDQASYKRSTTEQL